MSVLAVNSKGRAPAAAPHAQVFQAPVAGVEDAAQLGVVEQERGAAGAVAAPEGGDAHVGAAHCKRHLRQAQPHSGVVRPVRHGNTAPQERTVSSKGSAVMRPRRAGHLSRSSVRVASLQNRGPSHQVSAPTGNTRGCGISARVAVDSQAGWRELECT